MNKEWKVLPLEGKYYGTKVQVGNGIVDVWMPMGSSYSASVREIENGWEPDWGFDHIETQESYAVARLIAAAPDLLEALRVVQRRLDEAGYLPIPEVDAAIAKATGENV